jgi:hypothetical protein
VSFHALVGLQRPKKQVEDIMGQYSYSAAVHLQKVCRWVPTCPLWSNNLLPEDLLLEEDEHRLLESGGQLPLTC